MSNNMNMRYFIVILVLTISIFPKVYASENQYSESLVGSWIVQDIIDDSFTIDFQGGPNEGLYQSRLKTKDNLVIEDGSWVYISGQLSTKVLNFHVYGNKLDSAAQSVKEIKSKVEFLGKGISNYLPPTKKLTNSSKNT